MDRHSSRYTANFFEDSPNTIGEYQISDEHLSGSPNGAIRLPSHYPGWSLPSTAESKLSDSYYDASPLSSGSHSNLDARSWNGNHKPFDTSFSNYFSLPNEASPLSIKYNSSTHQSWLTSPASSSDRSYLSPQPKLSIEKARNDTELLFQEPNWRIETEVPVLSPPIKAVSFRRIDARVSKSTSRGIAKQKRTKSKALRSIQDATASITQPCQAIVALSYPSANASEGQCMEARSATTKHSKEEEDKERHKYVEMKYRMQMKDRFEELLRSLPGQNGSFAQGEAPQKAELDKKMTRGKVLGLAKDHIDSLDQKRRVLEKERDMLKYQIGLYETAWLSTGFGELEG